MLRCLASVMSVSALAIALSEAYEICRIFLNSEIMSHESAEIQKMKKSQWPVRQRFISCFP